MPVEGRGLKLMLLFLLMFPSMEKEFRNLAKMGPVLKIFYLSISAGVLWGRKDRGRSARNQVDENLLDNAQCFGNEIPQEWSGEDKVIHLVAPAPLSRTHTPCLEGSCPVLCLLHQLAAKPSFCKTNTHKHISSYPKGVFNSTGHF